MRLDVSVGVSPLSIASQIAAMVSGDIFLDPNMASALAMVLVGLMTLITIVHQWLLRRSYHVAR